MPMPCLWQGGYILAIKWGENVAGAAEAAYKTGWRICIGGGGALFGAGGAAAFGVGGSVGLFGAAAGTPVRAMAPA